MTSLLLGCLTIPLFYLAWESYGLDFRAFYVASTSLANNLDPYADNRVHGEQFADTTSMTAASRWLYPPPALFVVAPLARVSYTTARLLFEILSFTALIWTLSFLANRFEVEDRWVMLAYTSLPVVACIERGQIDLLVLFLMVLTFACGKRAWAGVPLGIAISIKIFPVALLLWFVVQRRYREALATILCVLAIGLLSVWRFGISSYIGCLHNLSLVPPRTIYADPVDLLHRFGIPNLDGRWLSLSQGFIGSYNNPLILLDNYGIFLGLALSIAAAVALRRLRVSPTEGFFTMMMISQLLNTRLWAMGLVMYLPICLFGLAKTKSTRLALLMMVPLYLPSQVRVLGVSPRFVIALAVVAFMVVRGMQQTESPAGDGNAEGISSGVATEPVAATV